MFKFLILITPTSGKFPKSVARAILRGGLFLLAIKNQGARGMVLLKSWNNVENWKLKPFPQHTLALYMQIPIICEIFRGNVKTHLLSFRLLAVLVSGKGIGVKGGSILFSFVKVLINLMSKFLI